MFWLAGNSIALFPSTPLANVGIVPEASPRTLGDTVGMEIHWLAMVRLLMTTVPGLEVRGPGGGATGRYCSDTGPSDTALYGGG